MTHQKGADFRFSPRPHRAHEIAWRPWGEAAFAAAQQQQKPLLLAISAVWCHWCHVMDETSYSDEENIRLINDLYIPVRVDNDRRPDINQRYNQGGWPTTAFLSPEGEVLVGFTYVPPGPFRSILQQVAPQYQTQRAEIAQRTAEHEQQRTQWAQQLGALPTGELTASMVGQVVEAIVVNYDQLFGGFGTEPKFPHPDVLEFLLFHYQLSGDQRLLPMVTKTLDAMASGGMYDHVEGGFFRYSTTRDWTIPHFEKMLEDHAGLLRVYLRAYRLTGNEGYRRSAADTMRYINTYLLDPQRGFYGSQDADEHYYSLPLEERRKVPAPFVDRTFYVSWNAMMAMAYLEAAWTLVRPPPAAGLPTALRVLDFLWQECRHPLAGMYHYYDGAAQQLGLLADQVHTARALVHASEVTGETRYLEAAQELANLILRDYADPQASGFFDIVAGTEALAKLRYREKSIFENASVAELCTNLFYLTGEERWLGAARSALLAFAPLYHRYGYFGARYAQALERFLKPMAQVTVVGPRSASQTQALLQGSLRLSYANHVVQVVDPEADRPLLEALGYPQEPAPALYLCLGQSCTPPLREVQELESALKHLLATVAPERRESHESP